MYSRSLLSTAAVALIAAGGPALAGGFVAPVAETPVVAPVVLAQPSDWAGAYVGGSLGYAFGGDDEIGLDVFEGDDLFGRGTDLGAVDLEGLNAGVQLGYRWQRDSWVFGPELWLEGGSIDASDSVSYTETSGGTTFELEGEFESEVNWLAGLQFKTGYVVNPQTLVYGTAGVVHGDFDYRFGPVSEGYSETGYSLGLGAERMLRDNLSVFAEWQYRNFGKTDVEFDLGDGDRAVTRATPENHNLKLGVNFSF